MVDVDVSSASEAEPLDRTTRVPASDAVPDTVRTGASAEIASGVDPIAGVVVTTASTNIRSSFPIVRSPMVTPAVAATPTTNVSRSPFGTELKFSISVKVVTVAPNASMSTPASLSVKRTVEPPFGVTSVSVDAPPVSISTPVTATTPEPSVTEPDTPYVVASADPTSTSAPEPPLKVTPLLIVPDTVSVSGFGPPTTTTLLTRSTSTVIPPTVMPDPSSEIVAAPLIGGVHLVGPGATRRTPGTSTRVISVAGLPGLSAALGSRSANPSRCPNSCASTVRRSISSAAGSVRPTTCQP